MLFSETVHDQMQHYEVWKSCIWWRAGETSQQSCRSVKQKPSQSRREHFLILHREDEQTPTSSWDEWKEGIFCLWKTTPSFCFLKVNINPDSSLFPSWLSDTNLILKILFLTQTGHKRCNFPLDFSLPQTPEAVQCADSPAESVIHCLLSSCCFSLTLPPAAKEVLA